MVAPTRWAPILVLYAGLVGVAGEADVREAVVKIYSVRDSPDYYNPWRRKGPQQTTGSGCIVSGQRILTNAHVVSDQTFLQVRRYGRAERHQARVLSVAHEVDLALIEVTDDPGFCDGVEPLALGEVPQTQAEATVYGFPMGGDTLSTTRGVISRLEHQVYAHSSFAFLAGQIDAAINPGNSGGPVVVGGRLVGIVMQVLPQSQNIGYMVPVNLVRHFFDDLADGRYDGFPSLGLLLQDMENPDLRARFGMTPDQAGVLVVKVAPRSAADGLVQPGDVVTAVAGFPVASDGTVEFRPKERTAIQFHLQEHQIGDVVPVEILRAGQPLKLDVRLTRPVQADLLVPNEQYETNPTYFIYGGIVFCPLTRNLLQVWGPNWYNAAPKEVVAILGVNVPENDGDQVVVALKTLAASVNEGYHELNTWVVDELNGAKVRRLDALVRALDAPSEEVYAVFENRQGEKVVLSRQKARSSRAEILATYMIDKDRSDDLPAPPSR